MLEFRLHGCSTPVLGIKMARTGQFSELTPTRVCWEALHPRAWQAPGFVLPGMPAEKLPVCASQARTCSHVRCQKKSPLQQPAAGGDASLIHLPRAVFPWGFISLLHPSHFDAARVEGLLRALPSSQLPSVPVWCYSMTHGTSILPQAEKILSLPGNDTTLTFWPENQHLPRWLPAHPRSQAGHAHGQAHSSQLPLLLSFFYQDR